jgi:hypothetical protein
VRVRDRRAGAVGSCILGGLELVDVECSAWLESVPQTFQICAIQLRVKQLNGSVSWLLGYAYRGLPPSQCQNKTEYYTDVFDRTIVIHEFNQTAKLYG